MEWNKTGTLLLVRYGNEDRFYGDRILNAETDNVPNGVHIYDFPTPSEPFVPRLRCVLMHVKPVIHARWNPMRKGSLAICCGTQSVFTWSDEWVGEGGDEEDMAECIGVPASSECAISRWHPVVHQINLAKYETRDVRWAPDGKGMVLMDKDRFCCAFEVEEGE